jgi:hypothetical protein
MEDEMSESEWNDNKYLVVRRDHIVEGGEIENPNGTVTVTFAPDTERADFTKFVLALDSDPAAYAAGLFYSMLCFPKLAAEVRSRLQAVRHHGMRTSATGRMNLPYLMKGLLKLSFGDMLELPDKMA